MAFEYSGQSRGIAFPNPLRMHNRFLIGAAVVMGIFAIAILFSVRSYLADGQVSLALPAVAIALALLIPGLQYLYRCLSHLRFYFGIGRPHGLVTELAPEVQGTTPFAEQVLKEPLRQQAIRYREPNGPITGLLYSLVPKLIYAPDPLRRFAEWQFKGGVTLIALLIGLIFALIIGVPSEHGGGRSVSDAIGTCYLAIAVWILIHWNPTSNKSSADSGFLSVERMSVQIAGPIVVPILLALLAKFVRADFPFHPYPHVFLFLLAGIAIQALFFACIVTQLMPPPPTAVSVIQETWNLSSNPAMIMGEFLRAMQESWREKIPNRRYVRIEPQVNLNASAGAFRGEIIEETQPFPRLINTASEDQISSSGSRNLLLALEIVGVVFTFVAALSAYLMSHTILAGQSFPAVNFFYALVSWSLGFYALSVAQWLRLRFDFASQLFWVEMNGQYVSAQVNQGNSFRGNHSISSSVVQVEGMTFRLWAAEIHSVTFGKDAQRYIVSMAGIPDAAKGVAGRLKDFIDSQATIVSIGTAANAERVAANNMLGKQTDRAGRLSTGEAAIGADTKSAV